MSTYTEFSRGSEWRKWDLHIHSNASDGEATLTEIIDAAILKGLDVIALTDHHTAKNIDEIKRIAKTKNISIISGIEFRTEYGSSSVHMIGLFPDSHEEIELNGKALHDLILCPLKLSETEIIAKGKEKKPELNDVVAFKEGMFLVQVNFKEAADLIHKYGGIISVHAGSKSNTVEDMKHIGTSQKNVKQLYDSLGTVKEELLKNYVDICEIRKEDDSEDFYYSEFGLPSIIASDAHNKNTIGDKFVWIKADKTFEGLKQILCEPEGRIKIQSTDPSSKTAYNIIEKVKFIDDSWLNKFSPREIGFNPDLNAIIGGKSSGKSLLLHSIAKAVGNKTDIKNYTNVLEYIDLEIYYADAPNQKRTPEDRRIIEFLPQLFIEDIVRNKSHNDDSSNTATFFNKFIEDLICQNIDIQNLYDVHNSRLVELKNKIESSIKEWIQLDKELFDTKNSLKPLGDKTAISKEITTLSKKIEQLTSQSGLNETEQKMYADLTESNMINDNRINIFVEHKAELERLREYAINDMFIDILNTVDFETADTFTSNLFNSLKKQIEKSVQLEIQKSVSVFDIKLKKIEKIILRLNNNVSSNLTKLAPLLAKNKIQFEIETLKNSVKTEQEKLANIKKKEKEILEILEKRNNVNFIHFYEKVFNSYKEIVKSVNEKIGEKWINTTGLTLTASIIFDIKRFADALASMINVHSSLENQMSNCGFSESNYVYNEQNHIANVKNILLLCIQDESRFNNFKKVGNTESLLRLLFQNYWYIDFDIKKGSDSLQNMSEGKKGIVVLQLYLSLSKSDYPILIDQPEDNLDNRTVYNELNEYIKQCKQRRQIIMVSHNANLVVNTDAENVIVANQQGEDGKENKDFKFEYVNGALENTFTDETEKGILYQKGIREHVCEILEGGINAFKKREEKYNLK
ncbi:DNA repair ATPase [Spirochaetia bacterium]|nr:DNA repair ATPase [Spirochaetia bacterium]